MPGMTGRYRRKRRGASFDVRVMASLVRVGLVVLVSTAAGYTFYLALQWVASDTVRHGVGG